MPIATDPVTSLPRRHKSLTCMSLVVALLVLAGCDTFTGTDTAPDRTFKELEQVPDAQSDLRIAGTLANGCTTVVNPLNGSIYRFCSPEGEWNGGLVVYAHGYRAPGEDIALPREADCVMEPDESFDACTLVTNLNFAFATTSFPSNGLVIQEGIADVLALVDFFKQQSGLDPLRTYLAGPSEGGLITTLGVERHADVFDGGLATCGPYGDFQKQINHFGDFRVVFDYFFPGVIPGSPIDIPPGVIDQWETVYAPAVDAAIRTDAATNNGAATRQLLSVTRVPVESANDLDGVIATVLDVLWYNIFATNDARGKLGGQPFANRRRIYFGSDNDFRLNRRIARFSADHQARHTIRTLYETSGDLTVPLVTEHTTRDPIVPFWHQPLYRLKAYLNGSFTQYSGLPIPRFGHCTFEASELLLGFTILVLKSTGQLLEQPELSLPNEQQRVQYRSLEEEHRELLVSTPLSRGE